MICLIEHQPFADLLSFGAALVRKLCWPQRVNGRERSGWQGSAAPVGDGVNRSS